MSLKGLGRGFESLIPTELVDEEFDPTGKLDETLSALKELKLDLIAPDSEQPRKEFNQVALEALADSIRMHGVLQPIVVVKGNDKRAKYLIVAGERRWRAAKLAGLETVPAIVRTMDDQKRLEMSVIENAQREDLNAIELATAYAKLKAQFNLSPKEIGQRIGKSESAVVNTMRLLNLPEEAKRMMLERRLSEGVMRPLIGMNEAEIMKVLPRIVDEGWSVRKVEQYVSSMKKTSSAVAVKVNNFFKREEELNEKYQTRVKINRRSVTFMCKNEKELEELIERLTK